jgi:hypothetical protein
MYARSQKNILFSLTSKNSENGIWAQLGLKFLTMATGHCPSSCNKSHYISGAGSASIFRSNGEKGRSNN